MTRYQDTDSAPEFKITPDVELILTTESDNTKRYLIKQACIATQQNAHQIQQQHKLAVWAEAHEITDLEEFAKLAPIVSAWKTFVSVKGVLMTVFTAVATTILVAMIVHWMNLK